MNPEMMTNKWWRVVAYLCCIALCVLHRHASRVGFFLDGIHRATQEMPSRPQIYREAPYF